MNKLIALVLVVSVSGCSFLKGKAGTDLKQCASSALQTETDNLLPAVFAILVSGKPDWQSQLDALEKMAGVAVLCAVQAIVSNLHSSNKDFKAEYSTQIFEMEARASEYLKAKNAQ